MTVTPAAIDTWVFDLDNTLYPAATDLFAQIDARMTAYVSALLCIEAPEARRIQKLYYAEHGTTLSGLMQRHHVDPHDFLHFVHDIDLAPLAPDPALARAIAALPGKKLIFTNGSHGHADRVVRKLGLDGLFDDYFDIVAAEFQPKPERTAFDLLLARYRFDPARAVMFEDLARNLAPAHALGMTTVLVHSAKDWSHEPANARPAGPGDEQPAHVHFTTDCLRTFLTASLARA